jgi:hypothetical protein
VISKLTHRIFVGRIGILVVVLVTIGQIEPLDIRSRYAGEHQNSLNLWIPDRQLAWNDH